MMRRILCGLVVGVLAGATFVSAEDAKPKPAAPPKQPDAFDPFQAQLGFGVRDTPSARFALNDARRYLSSGDTLLGLRAAQRVLDEMQDDFYLLPSRSSASSILWRSAAEVARERLAGLDAKGRTAYNEFVRSQAESLIERALATGNQPLLEEVMRRFGASAAGLRAARLLTELSLEAGRWRDAERYAREGLRFAPRDGALWRRAMDALRAAGDPDALRALAIPEGVRISRNGATSDGTAERDRLLALIPPREESVGWPMWGGAPDRARVLTAKPPIPTRLRWQEGLSVAHRRLDTRTTRRMLGTTSTSEAFRSLIPHIYPVQPVAVGRTVYVADGRSVRAYDMFSGRAVWHYNYDTAKEVHLVPDDPGIHLDGRSSLERAYSPVVAGDRVVATIELAQVLDEDKVRGIVIEATVAQRCLVCLDRGTGDEAWTRLGHHDIELPNASVVSPPVVSEGLVIALISQYSFNHNISFVAFDLTTGALRWKRSLGFGQQELNLFGYPTKELAGSAVAAADGVAYASSGLGFIAAVDIRSGVPRWLASYEPIEIRPVDYWYEAPVRRPHAAASPPMVHKNLLIVAPTDSKYVYAYDRRTGDLKWRELHHREGLRPRTLAHVLGIANDGKRDVLIQTDSALRARDVNTGEQVWLGRMSPDINTDRPAEVLGRGALAGGLAVIPTEQGLQHFSIQGEGKFLGRHPWPNGSRAGNVLATGQALLVTTRNRLYSFYDWKDIEAEANRRMRENPDDPTALLEAGELYWKGRQIDRAREAFERALKMKSAASGPANRRARQGLMNTWLSAGELMTEPDSALRATRTAMDFADTSADRVRVHLAVQQLPALSLVDRITNLAALIKVSGNIVTAFRPDQQPEPLRARARLELAALHQAGGEPKRAVNVLQDVLREDRGSLLRDVPAGELAEKRIAAIVRANGRDVYAAHDKAAKALLDAAEGKGAADTLQKILAQFPNAEVVPLALERRATQRLTSGDGPGAAADLLRLLGGLETPEDLARTMALLHDAWTAAGARGAARYAAVSLGRQYKDVTFTRDGTEYTGASFAATLDQLEIPEERTLAVPLQEHMADPAPDEARLIGVAQWDDPSGGTAPMRLAWRTDRQLIAYSLKTRKKLWSVPCQLCRKVGWSPYGLITASGNNGRDIEGRNPDTGAVLWTEKLGRVVRDLVVTNGQAFVLSSNPSRQKADSQIDALDVTTGRRLWTRPLGTADHSNLGTWGDRIYVDRRRLSDGNIVTDMRLFDGTRGTSVGDFRLPDTGRSARISFDGQVVAGYQDAKRRGPRVASWSLEDASQLWDVAVEGKHAVHALTPAPDGRLVVLRANGDLLTLDARTGEQTGRTRVFVGTPNVLPFPGTMPQVYGSYYLLVPHVRSPDPVRLMAYDVGTGKLKWDVVLSRVQRPNRIEFGRSGRVLWIQVSSRGRQSANEVILADADTGKRLQRLTPKGLSQSTGQPPDTKVGHGALILLGNRAAAIWGGSNHTADKDAADKNATDKDAGTSAK